MHYSHSCSASRDTATPGQVARKEAEGVKYLHPDPQNCFKI